MSYTSLIKSLEAHANRITEDRLACDQVISWIEEHEDSAFIKSNLAWHLTGSMMITNPSRTRVLMMFHLKLQIWLQFGGHCDGDTDIRCVAIREFHEESGVIIEPEIVWDIFMVWVHDVPMDKKWTPRHYHFDLMYLGVIPDDAEFARQESEVDDIRWFDIDGIEKYIAEEWMVSRIKKISSLK
jgi:8-oxo-dGTP pyrophosphatase MutT (NUDIX family)